MPTDQTLLHAYEVGELTVVSFGGRTLLDDVDPTACRAEAVGLIEEHGCKILAFDVLGVPFLPSGLLGLMVSLRQLGIEVHLYNPCADIREVLEITHLNKVIPVRHVDVNRACV